jgi:acetoin utilization protein AcuB
MFVRTYMTPNPITISPDDAFPEGMHLIRKHDIRHIPVAKNDRLVGIVVESDLLSNQPSPATTLSVHEIYSLLEKLRISQIMTRPVITVEGDCPIEEAARIMVENSISCLPVMEGETLVGIITETDIFKALVDILGGKETGFRLSMRVPDQVGELASISDRIAESGGNIVAVTSSSVQEDGKREVMIKEVGADQESLLKWLQGCGIEVVDVRASKQYQPRMFG